MSRSPKRILILVSEAGFGHLSAARAIDEALRERYGEDCQVEIFNPMNDDRTPVFIRNTQTDYDRTVRENPDLYKLSYDLSDTALTSAFMEGLLTLALRETMRASLEVYQPDVIVSVREHYLAPLDDLFRLSGQTIPVVTVITDLSTIHRMWFHPVSRVCVVPTQAAYELALRYGLPEDRVRQIGIPVSPRFAQAAAGRTQLRTELRAEHRWHPDLTTVLVVGSKRVGRLDGTLRVLNHCGLPLQLVLVAGGDDERYEQFRAADWHRPTHIYNYVDNLPAFMFAADCIVTKAGGLIVSESLACGLPILLIDVIEGQETGNAEYVIHSGAGEFVADPIDLLETLYHWLANDGALLAERASNARRVGRPQAAYEIADVVWSMAQGQAQAALQPDPLPQPDRG